MKRKGVSWGESNTSAYIGIDWEVEGVDVVCEGFVTFSPDENTRICELNYKVKHPQYSSFDSVTLIKINSNHLKWLKSLRKKMNVEDSLNDRRLRTYNKIDIDEHKFKFKPIR